MENDLYPDEFDPRHIEGITPEMRYTAIQAAEIMGCSRELVIKLCDHSRQCHNGRNIDPRHYADFQRERKYSDSEVARRLNVSHTTIYNLRKCGEFEETPLRHAVRIPGWSVIDFINRNAADSDYRFQFIRIGKLIRIPGWGIIAHKKTLTI